MSVLRDGVLTSLIPVRVHYSKPVFHRDRQPAAPLAAYSAMPTKVSAEIDHCKASANVARKNPLSRAVDC